MKPRIGRLLGISGWIAVNVVCLAVGGMAATAHAASIDGFTEDGMVEDGSGAVPVDDGPDDFSYSSGGHDDTEAPFAPSGVIPTSCGTNPINSPNLVDCWLNANPSVAYNITWETSSGVLPWPMWDPTRKAALRAAFLASWSWYQSGLTTYNGPALQDPPQNQEPPHQGTTPEWVKTVLDEQTQAWPLYVAYVGHILATEMAAKVPWGIRTYDSLALNDLLSGHAWFHRHSEDPGDVYNTVYPGYVLFGTSTPALPTTTYKFLHDHGLIAPTPTQTIARVLDWARWNLVHFSGTYGWENVFHTWGYYGHVPVIRVLQGTATTDPNVWYNDWWKAPHHWTAGCYGTTGFLKSLLRAVNIPVRIKTDYPETCGHTMPYFPSVQRYLSHGDDPYDRNSQGDVAFPAKMMLITQSTWDAWFKTGVASTSCKNVGRQPIELMIDYPSFDLVQAYCRDTVDGKSHADGDVYKVFKPYHTVAELEARGLWQRIDYIVVFQQQCAY